MIPALQIDTNATTSPRNQHRPEDGARKNTGTEAAKKLRIAQIKCCVQCGLVADRARHNPEPKTLAEAYALAEAQGGG